MFSAFHALPPRTQVGLTISVLFGIFAATLTAMVLLMRSSMTGLEQGQMLLMLTTIAGFMGTAWRESRNRKWAIEDRRITTETQTTEIIEKAKAEAAALLIKTDAQARALHVEAMNVAERIRLETLRAAAALREEQRVNAEVLAAQIQDVKIEAKKAYHEANNVNVKIEQLNERLLSEEKKTDKGGSAATDQKLDELQETADTIDGKVDTLAKKES